MQGPNKRVTVWKPGKGPSLTAEFTRILHLDFVASRIVRTCSNLLSGVIIVAQEPNRLIDLGSWHTRVFLTLPSSSH